jgi:hypothetical protein
MPASAPITIPDNNNNEQNTAHVLLWGLKSDLIFLSKLVYHG